MDKIEKDLLDLAYKNISITSIDIDNIAKKYNVDYKLVNGIAKGLEIDIISNSDVDSLIAQISDNDFNNYKNNPLLTKEEELQLFKRINFLKEELDKLDSGDLLYKQYKRDLDNIRLKIIDINTPLIYYIAKKFTTKNIQFDDLVSEGKLAMNNAIDKFDASKNVRFTTYAYYRIYQAIQRAIQNFDRSIRIPVHQVTLYSRVIKTFDDLTNELGRKPLNKEVARKLGISEDVVEFALSNSSSVLSLDKQVGEDKKATLSDLIADKDDLDPFVYSVNDYAYKIISKILAECSEKEADIFKMRYGLDYERAYKLDEIGKKYSISKERVRQIVEAIKRKIAKEASYLKDLT